MTLVWMALQALEATQNNLVVWSPGVMADIIVSKDICKRSFLAQCSLEQTGYPNNNNNKSYSALCLTGFSCRSQ